MAITLAEQESPSSTFSDSETFSDPLCFTFDGIPGGSKTKQLLITNTHATEVLSAFNINLTQPSGDPYPNLTIENKKEESDLWAITSLTPADTLNPGESFSFWVRLSVAADSAVQNIKDLSFEITWTTV